MRFWHPCRGATRSRFRTGGVASLNPRLLRNMAVSVDRDFDVTPCSFLNCAPASWGAGKLIAVTPAGVELMRQRLKVHCRTLPTSQRRPAQPASRQLVSIFVD